MGCCTRRSGLWCGLLAFYVMANVAQAQGVQTSLGELVQRTRSDLDDLAEALAQGGLSAGQYAEYSGRLEQLDASATVQQDAITAELAAVRDELQPIIERLDALRQQETALLDAIAKLPTSAAPPDPAAQSELARLEQQQRSVAAERAKLDARREPLRAEEADLVSLAEEVQRLQADVAQTQAEVAQRRQSAQTAQQLAALEAAAQQDDLVAEELEPLIAEASQLRELVTERHDALQAELTAAQEQLAALGAASSEAPPAERLQRATLEGQVRRLRQGLEEVALNLARADRLVTALQAQAHAATAERLLQREATVAAEVRRLLTEPQDWAGFGQRVVLHGTGFSALGGSERIIGLVLLLVAVPVGRVLRRRLLASAMACEPVRFGPALARAAYASLARHATALAVVATAAALMSQIADRTQTRPALNSAVYALLLYLAMRSALRSFLAPYEPAASFTALGREREWEVARRISVLVLVGVFGFSLFAAADALAMPETPYRLARAAFVILFSINLAWLLHLLGKLPKVARYGRALRVGVIGLLTVAVGAELTGYHNLAYYLLLGVVGTAAMSPVLWVARRLAAELLDGLQFGSLGWTATPRGWLGLRAGERLPGIAWLRFLVGAVIYLLCAWVLLRLWTSPSGFDTAREFLKQGVTVGSLTLQPDLAVAGMLTFAALMAVSHWFRRGLEHSLGSHEQLDQGARVATATLVGYVAFAISGLTAVTVSGLDLTKLAVVLGALSVGIGFGLQNIVNNFVSGVILLFERPIRVGDWIKVGNVEGHVRKLSVRSTEIQGFDKQETIVPNSDLISQPVINLTRYNPVGRVVLPVGVAYGSDARLVEKLLYEIAERFRDVCDEVPGFPVVLFIGFGESSLDFELRLILRDINNKLTVSSDLNFAIYDAFAAHGIEIPFPQRDVWLRTAQAGGEQPRSEAPGPEQGTPTTQ